MAAERLEAPEAHTFLLYSASGEIQTAHFPFIDNIYCKINIVHGKDWLLSSEVLCDLKPRCDRISVDAKAGEPLTQEFDCKIARSAAFYRNCSKGNEEDLTHVTKKTRGSHNHFVFNHPFDVTYKFTNPFGWPQLILSIYGLDALGNDVVRGYGTVHLPCIPGRHCLRVPLQAPESSSVIQKLSALITGKRPELVESRVFADESTRQLLRMSSDGLPYVEVVTNVAVKDLDKFGFDVGSVQSVSDRFPFF